jgi:hypothetical protein
MIVQCNCGAVKVELTGDPIAQFYCHCDDCQKVHGAAYVPVAMYPIPATKIVSGEPSMTKLRVTPRAMCKDCGTRIFAEPGTMGVRGVVATVLPKGIFKPQFHVQCQHAMLPVKDLLPHYKGYPKMWGGSDDRVEW